MKTDETQVDGMTEQRLQQLTRQTLDGATLSRLRQARANALQQASARKWSLAWSRPALVTAFSMSVLGVTLLLMSPGNEELAPIVANADIAQPLEDFNLLANGEDLDLVNELEFFEWLDQQHDDKGGLG